MKKSLSYFAFALVLSLIATGKGAAQIDRENGKAADEHIKVEVREKLNSQIFAIGGETTGVVITANGVTWELELGKKAELHEKTVVVTGQLHVKTGVEIRKRWIVNVASLKSGDAGGDSRGNPYLTDDGALRHPLVLEDSQGGFAGFSGYLWTIETDCLSGPKLFYCPFPASQRSLAARSIG